MTRKVKFVVLAILSLIIVGIMVGPNLYGRQAVEFAVTSNPADALNDVLAKGQPVVLEFYAVW